MAFTFSYEELDSLTSCMSDTEIASSLGISYAVVRDARIHFGLKTFTQKTGLVRIKATGELRPKGSVRGVVRRDGLKVDYFRSIDEPEKAYWLGALLADGWVCTRGGRPKEVGLAVKESDKEWLKSFQAAIGHVGRVTTKENKNSLAKSSSSHMSTVRVTCQAFTKWAIEAGITERKSGNLVLPAAANAFPADFCRGFCDGDGSIGKVNFTLICNSEDFAHQVSQLIKRETGQTLHYSECASPQTGKYVSRLCGYRKNRDVLAWMYQDRTPSLARKYDRFSRFWL